MIYLISDGKNLKIGHSKNPFRRLKQLQTGHSSKLKLIKVYDLPDWVEKRLHYLLRSTKARDKGEWFTCNDLPETLEFIELIIDAVTREVTNNLLAQIAREQDLLDYNREKSND
jgi:hypothetical protein